MAATRATTANTANTARKAQHLLGLDVSWRRISLVFLIDVGVLTLAGHWPGDPRYTEAVWWSGVGVAALITILALVTYHKVTLTHIFATAVRDLFASPAKALARGATEAVDHQRRHGREPVGIRQYRGQLVAVIAVSAREETPPGRHSRGAGSTAELPIEVVAAGLSQFDMHLDGIDIVSVGRSRVIKGARQDAGHGGPGGGKTTKEITTKEITTKEIKAAKEIKQTDTDAKKDESDDQAPTVDDDGDGALVRRTASKRRRTWLVLRMNPQENMVAIAARDSVAATLAAAAERLVNDLDGRQVSAQAVTANGFATVDAALLAGLEADEIRVRRGYLKRKESDERVASFWLSPRDITSENLEELWHADTDATVVTVRINREHGRPRVSAIVRYHGEGKLDKADQAGLNRLTNRQVVAACASLPVPGNDGPAIPGRGLEDEEHLAIPVDAAVAQRVRVGARS